MSQRRTIARNVRNARRSKENPTVAAAAAAAVVEGLENRLLLAFTVTDRGTLVIDGTAGDDEIFVIRNVARQSRLTISINGVADSVALGSVRRVEIYGGAGNDDLRVDDSAGPSTALGVTIAGDDGDDTLVGSLRSASLAGGAGNDVLYGSSKTADLDGGPGSDTVFAGKGNDRVFGGDGNDLLTGWLGHDRIYGDAGNDTIEGEGGNDTLAGDNEDNLFFVSGSDPGNFAGNDSLDGGTGNDWLVGGKQSSTLDDDNGADTLRGGSGNDILDARGNPGRGNDNDTLVDREAGDIVPVETHTRQATPDEIAEGEDAYAVHDHADLVVRINDNGTLRTALVQGGIGDFTDPVLADTGPSLHVHAGQEGRIHMHDLDPRTFTLGDFFRNWGVSFSAEHIGRYVVGNGHELVVEVDHNGAGGGDSEVIEDPYNYVIQGENVFGTGDVITITYT
jgi:Ca2+-binding RTX toxin-like protein